MTQFRSSDGPTGVLDSSSSQPTRAGSAEKTRAGSTAFSQLRARYKGYRIAEAQCLARLCMASAYASALRVPHWMAQSQRDYASSMLGVHNSTLHEWIRVGRLLYARPELRQDFCAGRYPLRELDRIARRGLATQDAGQKSVAVDGKGEKEDGDSRTKDGTTELTTVSISGPAPAILYMEESLELARAMVGATTGGDDAVTALLAEASTDLGEDLAVEEARHRFHLGIGTVVDRSKFEISECEAVQRENPSQGSSSEAASSALALPHPEIPWKSGAAQGRAARRLHPILLRLLARRDSLRVRQEDQLYEWMLEGRHERCGYLNFERFARELLDLAPTSCTDRLRRARERRQGRLIAIARRDGVISVVQADLLHQVYRRCHIPNSDLASWIRYAAEGTVRRLRSAVNWARREMLTDYRRWSLAGCPPPTADQLRTGNHSLEATMDGGGGEQLSDALILWAGEHVATLRLRLSTETRDQLVILMASEQDQVRGDAPLRIPGWLALCRIFHRARESWRVHHQKLPASQRRILDRDGWRCAAPECTQRKNLQIHHLKYRSRGGDDQDSNRVTLCAFHHHLGEHGGLMRVRGEIRTDGSGLTWEMGLDEEGRAMRVYQNERLVGYALASV